MDDLISRQAVIEKLLDAENHAFNSYYKGLVKAHRIIADMPFAQPEIKKGYWIKDFGFFGAEYICSNCRRETHNAITYDLEGNQYRYEFCPHCGADMRGENNE